MIAAAWSSRWTAHDDHELQTLVWATALAQVSYEAVEAVVYDMLARGQVHPPNLPDLVDGVLTAAEKAQGTYPPDADQALDELRFYVERRGPRRGPPEKWSHPAVAAAVRAFSWAELCDGGDTTRAHFLRVYSDARARHHDRQRRSPQMAALMAGIQPTAELEP